jgi:hypothetical protein
MLGLSSVAFAQVSIQSILPATGMIQKNQLWNLVMINSTASSVSGKIELVLYDRQTAREVLTASTSSFILAKGSVLLSISQLNPIQYNYIGIEPDRNLNGILPAGAYNVCYSFIQTAGVKQELLAEECVAFDVEPLSPPVLSFPMDSSITEITPAQFSWIPPSPIGMIQQLRYELLITEVKPGQKPAEAIADNVPFFSTASLQSNFFSYPAASPVFEKEKWYAWQVIARDNKNYAGKTEVWTFKVTEPSKPKTPQQSLSYIVLKDEQAKAQYQIDDRNLYVKYHSYLPSQQTTFDIFNNEGVLVQSIKQNVVYGDNFLHFELNRNFHSDHLYTIKVAGQYNRIYSASFSIK